MTLAVLGKVPEGYVLATDRIHRGPDFAYPGPPSEVGGDAIFLWPRHPLGALVWGASALGPSAVSEIASLVEETPLEGESLLDEVSLRLARLLSRWGRRKFLGLRPYLRPRVGFFLAGFETQRGLQGRDRVWDLSEPFSPPRPVRVETPDTPQCGFNWRGQEIWMTRLILGYDPRLLELIRSQFSLPEEELLPLFRQVEMPISYSGMDMNRALEMAAFMIHTTLSLLRLQGLPGQWEWEIEMAVITPQGAQRVVSTGPEETG